MNLNFFDVDQLKRHSVALCYIHNGEVVTPGFVRSMLEFQHVDHHNASVKGAFSDASGAFHEDNRNRVVREVLKDDKQWTMWIDTDILFDPEQIYALITQAHPIERPVVGGLYFGFPENFQTIAPIWYEDGEDNNFHIVSRLDGNPMQRIRSCGMGFCLIHRTVFEAMPERKVAVDGVTGDDPWRWFGRDLWVRPDGSIDRMGEDMSFFRRLWKEVEWHGQKGVPVYGHRGVTVRHRKARDIGVEDFLAQQRFIDLASGKTPALAGSGQASRAPGMGRGAGGAATILDANGRVVRSDNS